MYGLSAISDANGWAIAVAGGLIVMAGLSALSFIISLLPRAVSLMENREQAHREKKEQLKNRLSHMENPVRPGYQAPLEIERLEGDYAPLARELGESFQLRELYALSQENKFAHNHLSIQTLVREGRLVPLGDGVFSWRK